MCYTPDAVLTECSKSGAMLTVWAALLAIAHFSEQLVLHGTTPVEMHDTSWDLNQHVDTQPSTIIGQPLNASQKQEDTHMHLAQSQDHLLMGDH